MAESSIWDYLAPSLAVIGGTALVSKANKDAAAKASQAAIQGAQIQADAIQRGNEAIIAGNQQAQTTLAGLRDQSQPGTTYLRQVVAEPGSLTPAQQQQLNDQRLSEANLMHSTSFAGSGRAGAALLQRSDSDFVNAALDTNRQRAMTAASELHSAGTGATSGIASSQASTGTQVAAGDTGIGKAQGDAVSRAGLYDANAGLATGNVMGKAIGDIGSMIANQKRTDATNNRQSSYATTPTTRLAGVNGVDTPRPSSYASGDGSSGYNPSYIQ